MPHDIIEAKSLVRSQADLDIYIYDDNSQSCGK